MCITSNKSLNAKKNFAFNLNIEINLKSFVQVYDLYHFISLLWSIFNLKQLISISNVCTLKLEDDFLVPRFTIKMSDFSCPCVISD